MPLTWLAGPAPSPFALARRSVTAEGSGCERPRRQLVGDGEIEESVAVEVARGETARIGAGGDRLGRAEAAVAIARVERDRANHVVRDREVELLVAVEVADREAVAVATRDIVGDTREAP